MASRDRKSDSARTLPATPSAAPSNPPAPPSSPRPLTICARRFGAHLRAIRLRQALSQQDLAVRARMYRTHISLIEHGRRSVRLQTICVLATALGVQPRDLMPELTTL